MKPLQIAVLFGGCSPEYEVSLESAYAVAAHMDPSKYRPVLLGIARDGRWFHYTGDMSRIPTDTWQGPDCAPAVVPPGQEEKCLLVFRPGGMERIHLDAAFPVLHGQNGEDGTVQGVFQLAGIPVVGCGTAASALCMDKARAHRLARDAGVDVPASVVLEQGMEAAGPAEALGYPLFVKPVRAGSSFGISRVDAPEQLESALQAAFQYDREVILEEAIPGFEVGCAVMGSGSLTVGELDEIELAGGFFDFREKYTLETSAIHVPARISPEKAAEIKDAARRIYRALGCRGFARVDLFLEPSGRVVFNEVNTIPGFTAHSRYPRMMEAAGIPFGQVLSSLIALALEDRQ